MIQIIWLGLAVATVATTVCQSKLFKPIRTLIAAHSEFFGELISCPYCFAHWVSVAAVQIAPPENIPWVFSWLAVTAIAALTNAAIVALHHSGGSEDD